MINKKAPGWARPRGTDWTFGPEDVRALERGQMIYDDSGLSLNQKLNRGLPLSPEEQRHADALNQALAKLPSHEGPVLRHMNLNPEQLARYEPGQPVTEHGFPSSSLKPEGTNPQFVQNQNTEFQIVSKTGKPVGQYSGIDDEILFPSGTGFMVRDKFIDPKTGKMVIQMSEI